MESHVTWSTDADEDMNAVFWFEDDLTMHTIRWVEDSNEYIVMDDESGEEVMTAHVFTMEGGKVELTFAAMLALAQDYFNGITKDWEE